MELDSSLDSGLLDKEDADAAFENSIHKRAELRTLKVKPLLAIVMHAGVEEDATEDAMDAEDPKEAVIDLYFEAIARSRKEREEEGALMEAAEEARRQVAEREAAERETVRAAAVEKANQRAAREAAGPRTPSPSCQSCRLPNGVRYTLWRVRSGVTRV